MQKGQTDRRLQGRGSLEASSCSLIGKGDLVVAKKGRSEPNKTEVTAQISVPRDGGWGWVVVFSAFCSICILDSCAFTYGSQLKNVAQDLQVSEPAAALINSMAVSVAFLCAPIASAVINRLGFRTCVMIGSVVCSIALTCSYFAPSYPLVVIFSGLVCGFGFCFINMTCTLVVGFYFEKLRSVALAIAACGSSIGVMFLFPVNAYIVQHAGWRTLTLMQAGMFASIFFFGMAFRPLLSVSVKNAPEDEPAVAVLMPSLAKLDGGNKAKIKNTTTATERMFKSMSNAAFPTASSLLIKSQETEGEAGTSRGSPSSRSRLMITASNPGGTVSKQQLRTVQSNISKKTRADSPKTTPIIEEAEEQPTKQGLFEWEKEPKGARPMYRDDAFYEGSMKKLPAYQQAKEDAAETKTGLEYQMRVTRAVAHTDLEDRRCKICSPAVRRVFATMMDPVLLGRTSFKLMCCWAFFTYLGFLVPYIFLKNRNLAHGVNPKHCAIFVSVISGSNGFGRIALGILAGRLNTLKLFRTCILGAGISTLMSGLTYNVVFQYAYCCTYGFCVACIASLRSMVIVDLYGLEKLTNATGMMLLFQGCSSLLSSPLASMLQTNLGYEASFYAAGGFFTMAGLCLVPVKALTLKEDRRLGVVRPT